MLTATTDGQPSLQATNPNRKGGKGGKHGKEQGIERWSTEEDALLRQLCLKNDGSDRNAQHNWHLIKLEFDAAFPGHARTVKGMRNRVLRLRKNVQLVKAGKTGTNHCRKCGQLKRGHVCTGVKPTA